MSTNISAIEKIRRAVDRGTLRAALITDLESLSDVREWAEALTTLADSIEEAQSAVEEWRDYCEDREEKANAREFAIEALDQLSNNWDEVTALPGVPGLVKDDL